MDMGANLTPQGVHFRVWAPSAQQVEVETEHGRTSLQRQEDGTWHVTLPGTAAGLRYAYYVDGAGAYPDPYSRFQPEGVHGPSEVVDPTAYIWQDHEWHGIGARGLVIYECHVGTATPTGTFDSLIGQLDRLKQLGVTAVEIMPVAEFSGTRNWGYDGVLPFAATRNYGGPEAFRRFVAAAHARGLGVILDVVYNHLGPEGNYLRQFSPYYFTDRHHTPWGDAINYDGEQSAWVRKLVLDNALYWVHEYHVDGLRLDAVHEIQDDSEPHLLQELTQTLRDSVRSEATADDAGNGLSGRGEDAGVDLSLRGSSPTTSSAPASRHLVLTAETDQNNVRYLLPVEEDGFGLDVVWADDFHHTLRRYLIGDSEGYYQDYEGTLAEVAQTIQQGWLYEGQHSRTLARPRGTPARQQPAWQFQLMLQNHDQVGNRPFGDRLHHGQLDLDRYRAASALLLLLPYTPILFMGQEFVASAPFQYFTDHSGDLGRLVTEGRRREFGGFSAFADPAVRETIPDPQAEQTFLRSKLPLAELYQSPGQEMHLFYRVLLGLRRADPVLSLQDRHAMHTRALTPSVLAIHRWHAGRERLLLVNFGERISADLGTILAGTAGREPGVPFSAPAASDTPQAPVPLGQNGSTSGSSAAWYVVLDTGERRFGGPGAEASVEGGLVLLPEHAAVLLALDAAAHA